jgi:DNA-binding IclR family transcriptional regulator
VRLILDVFALDASELGLSELARRTGVAKATVHRLATELVEIGLLERSGSSFRLSVHLFELGARVRHQRTLRDLALPFLQDLRTATRETIHLGIPQPPHVLYIERLSGHEVGPAPSVVAGRSPLHCSATGKAILAHLPPPVLESVLARPLPRFTGYTLTTHAVLLKTLDEVRRTGIAIEREEMHLGFMSVAAPVFGPGARLVGAVSATGPTARADSDALAVRVRACAAAISRAASSCWELA